MGVSSKELVDGNTARAKERTGSMHRRARARKKQ